MLSPRIQSILDSTDERAFIGVPLLNLTFHSEFFQYIIEDAYEEIRFLLIHMRTSIKGYDNVALRWVGNI